MQQRIIPSLIASGVLALLHIVVFGIAVQALRLPSDGLIPISIVFGVLLYLFNIGPRIKDVTFFRTGYIVAMIWLGILFLWFSTSLLYKVWQLAFGHSLFLYVVLTGLALSASIYALLNARGFTVREIEISIKGLTKPVKIAHLSDIHIGTVNRATYLRKIVTAVNKERPAVTLITGDLFDGSDPVHEEMFVPLDELTMPTYFSTGNHEEYEGLPAVKEAMSHLKARLLDGEMTKEGELQIIGVNDRQSLPNDSSLKTILPTIDYDQTKPTILMYHTPVEWDEALHAGVDLMLSGHTHNGQLFPFTILVHFAFKYVRGLFSEGHQHLHISTGAGTWGPPMRLGSTNEIVLLNLVPMPTNYQ